MLQRLWCALTAFVVCFDAFVVCFEQAMILIMSIFTLLIPMRTKNTEAQRQRAKFLAGENIHALEKERYVQCTLAKASKVTLQRWSCLLYAFITLCYSQ